METQNSTFIRRKLEPQPGFDIKTILRRAPVKGQVGIEIECEGNKFQKENAVLAPYWAYHEDHSLRGQDNAEYVLVKPLMFGDVPLALDDLWSKMDSYGTVLDVSNRTSVHVHLNCQKFYLNRVCSLMALYFIVEEALTEWCGDHRVGNLFCLRAKDAPAMIYAMKRFFRTDGQYELASNLHYAAMNANALSKFGSLEVRTLRGCTDKQAILDWVNILRRLYDLSAEFPDPRDICGIFSAEGPVGFFDTILGDMAPVVRAGINMSEQQLRDSLYEGIRLAQDLCYCRDWSLYKPMELLDDPFGRDPRKIMKRLGGMASTGATFPDGASPGSISDYLPSTASSLNVATWTTNQTTDQMIDQLTLPSQQVFQTVDPESDDDFDPADLG
jgi:hypothetical protein